MPTSVPRIQVTPACQSHADLLNYWSVLEGRSISSLCSALLEEAVVNAIKDGRAHPVAVQMMNAVIDLRKGELDAKFGGDLMKAKSDNKQTLKELERQEREENEESGIFTEAFQNSLVAGRYWEGVIKDEAQQKNEYNHRVAVIKEAVGLMNFIDKSFTNQALIKLLRKYADLNNRLEIERLYTFVEIFNQLELNDFERIDYLSYSEYLWEGYLNGKQWRYPDSNVITEEDVHKYGTENDISPCPF